MIKSGDVVKVKTKDEVLEGTLIEKPALLGGDTIILKLDNGYNIGIDKEKVISIDLVEERKLPKTKKNQLKINPELKNITIMSSGGTISSKVDYATGGVIASYTAEDFVDMCPELAEIANIKAKKIKGEMSENIDQEDWKYFCDEINKELEIADGIVFTCGTDTLGYIAAALSFGIRTDKPVIITAAQKSIDRGSSDAFFNLICAVKAATSNYNEIAVCMHGESSDTFCSLIRGTHVRKMHSSKRDAFQSINLPVLAKVTPEKVEEFVEPLKHKKELINNFSEDVSLIYTFPGMDEKILDSCKDKKGIILMGTGLGHIPDKIHSKVKELIDSGIFVGMTTQTIYGRVSPTVYSNLRRVSIGLGVTYLEDMIPETAFIKLSWCFGQTDDLEKVKELMTTNLVGEINDRHVE